MGSIPELKREDLVPLSPRRRAAGSGRTAKTTLAFSAELLERLDRYQKQLSAGRWRRGAAPTKSQLVEEALRAYLDAKTGQR
jgi:hypothetical protein